jgi:enamine deaminase RidA (YjgF/YER057c/UK114 family)
MRMSSLMIAVIAATASPLAAQEILRHPTQTPGIILESVTVPPGATMVYVSGQVPSVMESARAKPMAEVVPADFGDTQTQTVNVLGKIEAILARRGMTMRDVVQLTVYLVGDPKLNGRMDFAGMNAGYRQFFGTGTNPNLVARTTMQISALVNPGFLVEIDAVAAKMP